ncbi:hypothetical protein [Streptomyces apocyni]|uniref:hypothetical protein n=1 Tax=Streptomyces apocyni TaxID=2654677 RepID=UPI0012EA3ABF|nr:hypothetical protein [Streptomyces apocyni]
MYRGVGVVCALVAVVALASCQRSPGAGDGGGNSASASTGYGKTFLGVGECSSRGREFTEVPCTSERALARVIARHDGQQADANGRSCPERTDFVLHIDPRGVACMRNLEPPHPGDPGRGGGSRTIVGDCVYQAKAGEVRETACDGSGERRPRFKVMSAVATRAKCPPSTTLYVHLGGPKPVGCAQSL